MDLGAVVLDCGSSAWKFGFAGEDFPRVFMDSSVGLTTQGGGSATDKDGGKKGKNGVGGGGGGGVIFDLNNSSAKYSEISNPFTRGLMNVANSHNVLNVSNFDNVEGLAVKVFEEGMGKMFGGNGNGENSSNSGSIESYRDHPLMLVDNCYSTVKTREMISEIMFEEMSVKTFFLGRDAVMNCYANGKSTGIVVDVGGSGTTVTPVYEGWVEMKGVMRSPVGGDVMDNHFNSILDAKAGDGKEAVPSYLARIKSEAEREKVAKETTGSYHQHMRMLHGRYAKEMIAKVAEVRIDR